MFSRREILTGGALGSVRVGHVEGRREASASLAEQTEREVQMQIRDALQGIEGSLRSAYQSCSLAYGPVTTLRKNFDTFLRSNGKFPDYCEVGYAVFYDMYDWHVKNHQQLTVIRQPPENRYTMQYMFTLLILRHEYDPGYIGTPYDSR